MFIAGCSYVIDALTYFFLPGYGSIVAQISTLPQALGEGGFVFWTLIKGAREDAA